MSRTEEDITNEIKKVQGTIHSLLTAYRALTAEERNSLREKNNKITTLELELVNVRRIAAAERNRARRNQAASDTDSAGQNRAGSGRDDIENPVADTQQNENPGDAATDEGQTQINPQQSVSQIRMTDLLHALKCQSD